MKTKFFILLICMLAGVTSMNAQGLNKNVSSSSKKHEIRLSVSDGIPRTMAEILGIGLADALTGTKRSDAVSWGVYSLGYRYSINRFRIGSDLSFAYSQSKLTFLNDKNPSIKERELNLMVLPTFEYVYYQKGLIELYGSAAAGVDFSRTSYKKMAGVKETVPTFKSDFYTSFAWQLNPIAIRIGNDRIGGFLEAGIGHKGFLTAGVSIRF